MYIINERVPVTAKPIDLTNTGKEYFPHLFNDKNEQIMDIHIEKRGKDVYIEYLAPVGVTDHRAWLIDKIMEFERTVA